VAELKISALTLASGPLGNGPAKMLYDTCQMTLGSSALVFLRRMPSSSLALLM